MPRNYTTESIAEVATVENAVATNPVMGETTEGKPVIEKTSKPSKEALKDTDEIEVVSMISNVSYKDNYSNDYYQWEKVGDVETMSFETLKNMWRNHKNYLKNMWLKPLDNRVLDKFGLTPTYNKYEYMMDKKNYTKDNIVNICNDISAAPNGMKHSVCNKVKSLIASGEIVDITVIRALERCFKLDLVSFLK